MHAVFCIYLEIKWIKKKKKREARCLRPRRQRLPTMVPSVCKACCLAGKVWGREEEFATVSPDGDGVFRIAKQMECISQDVGKNCVRNNALQHPLGSLLCCQWAENCLYTWGRCSSRHSPVNQWCCCTSSAINLHSLMMTWVMKAWLQHYARLLNIEFKWPCNELPELVRKLAEAVFSSGMTPVDWGRASSSIFVRARVKPLTMVTTVVSNSQIKSWSRWDGCQILPSARRWTLMRCSSSLCLVEACTTDAIFIVWQLQEKCIAAANKQLYFAFFDRVKAFGHVPRKVLC